MPVAHKIKNPASFYEAGIINLKTLSLAYNYSLRWVDQLNE